MAGCRWVEHRGVRILVVEYAGCLTDQEMREVLGEQVRLIRTSPSRCRVIHDYRNAVLTEGFLEESKRLSRDRREIATERIAILGLTGPRKALFLEYRMATGDTSSRLFDSYEESLDWLASP